MSVPKEEIQLFVHKVEAMEREDVALTLANARRLQLPCTPGSASHTVFASLIDYLERRLAVLDTPPPAGPS
jgi:hypothetical protein